MNIPRLSLGTCTMAGQLNEDASFRLLDVAYDHGIKFLDTAEGYPTVMRPVTHGNTEWLLGRWLRQRKHKDILINTKVFGPGNIFRGGKTSLAPEEVSAALDASLGRLGVEQVFCYMPHSLSGSSDHVKEAFVETMGTLMKSGKIKHWGLSNVPYETYEAYKGEAEMRQGIAGPILVQNRFSWANDPQGVDEAPVPLMAYGILRYGSFSGKYKDGLPNQHSRLPWLRDNFGWDIAPLVYSKDVEDLLAKAKTHYMDPVHFALNYVWGKSYVKNVCLGVTSPSQLKHILAAPCLEGILGPVAQQERASAF